MWKRFVLRTVAESDNQLVYTTNNYHFVIFTNILCANVNDNISLDRFFQETNMFKQILRKDANWDNRFVVPPGCNCGADYLAKVHRMCDPHAPAVDYEGPPRTGKGYREIQVVRNDRGLSLLPLLEAAP